MTKMTTIVAIAVLALAGCKKKDGEGGVASKTAEGGCQKWSKMFKWEPKPETCAWSQDAGKDVLTVGTGDWAAKVTADGDVLTNQQFDDEVKEELWKPSDLLAAKAWASGELAKDDPATKAAAEGGKAG